MIRAETTDSELLASVQDWADDAAWSTFFKTYSGPVRRFACSCGLSEGEADEVLQETMLRVVRYLPEFRYNPQIGRFRAWLNQIVRQRICEAVARRRKSLYPIEAVEHLLDLVCPDPGSDPAENSVGQILRARLTICTNRVRQAYSNEQWQIFEAVMFHRMKARAVAVTYGVSASKVWVTKHRVLKALQREWKNLSNHPFTED